MTDYDALSKIDFLPELPALDLGGRAAVIQSLLEESFFHPSGLFYSILLIDGPHHVRPMARADVAGISDTAADGHYDDGGASSEAARNEGMTFENSITSAGNYLQSQAARFAATADLAAYAEARWMIDLDGRRLKADVRWMECMLSSEAPFHYLTAYWRGRVRGYWE